MKKTVTVCYFSLLGPRRGIQNDPYETEAETARQLLHEIQGGDRINLTTNIVRAAINDELVDWEALIKDGDKVTLISPFSGG